MKYYSFVTGKEDNGNDHDAHHHHYHHHNCCVDLITDFLVSEEVNSSQDMSVPTPVCRWVQKQVITCAAIYGYDTRKKLSYSLGKHTIILEAEAQTINACAAMNIDIGCKNRNSYTLTDS
jgi:hypothetical protein